MADVADRSLGEFAQMAGTVIGDVPADETWIDAALVVCNVDTVTRYITAYIIEDSENAAAPPAKRAVLWNAPVDSPMTLELARGWTMKETDRLVVFCDEDDAVSCYLSFARRSVA